MCQKQGKSANLRDRADWWLWGAGQRGEWEVTATGCRVSYKADDNALELDSSAGCTP